MRSKWSAAVLALVTLIVGAGLGLSIDTTDDGNGHKTRTIRLGPSSPAIPNAVSVDTADPDNKPDTKLQLTPQAQNVAQGYVNNPKDLTDPAAIPLAGTGVQHNVGQVPFPMAADELPPCRTRFLPTNFSSRGVALSQVRAFELHYTAGPDIPNSRADVDGLTAFGSRSASRVSWHINMDKDGNCDYNVPFRMKAWTIANLNPVTINIEVAGRGEAPYLRAGGYRALARIYKQIHAAYPAITLRQATFSNCHVIVSGIGTHWQGGPCSGGHVDVKPLAISAIISQLKRYVAATSPKPITKDQRVRCGELNHIRALRSADKSTKKQERRAHAIKAGEAKNGLKCLYPPKPHRLELVRA